MELSLNMFLLIISDIVRRADAADVNYVRQLLIK